MKRKVWTTSQLYTVADEFPSVKETAVGLVPN